MTGEQLKAELRVGYGLERDIMCLEKLKTALETEARQPSRPEPPKTPEKPADPPNRSVAILMFMLLGFLMLDSEFSGGLVILMFLGAAYLWIKSIDEREKYDANLAGYQSRMKLYRTQKEDYRQRMAEYNRLLEISRLAQELLPGIRAALASKQKLLRSYYGANVIAPKYRNIAAVSAFLEYVENGRCDALHGAFGAYNKFEEETRQGLLIHNQGVAIGQLRQIGKVGGWYQAPCQTLLEKAVSEAEADRKRLLSALRSPRSQGVRLQFIAYEKHFVGRDRQYRLWLRQAKLIEG